MSYRVIAHSRSGEVAYRGTEVHGSYGAAEAEARVVARRAGLTDVHIVKDGERIVGEVKAFGGARSNPKHVEEFWDGDVHGIVESSENNDGPWSWSVQMSAHGNEAHYSRDDDRSGFASSRSEAIARARSAAEGMSKLVRSRRSNPNRFTSVGALHRAVMGAIRRAGERYLNDSTVAMKDGGFFSCRPAHLKRFTTALAKFGIVYRTKTIGASAVVYYDAKDNVAGYRRAGLRGELRKAAKKVGLRRPNPDRFAAHEIEVISWPTPWHSGHYPKMSKKDFKDYVKLNGWSAEVMCHGMRSVPGSLRDLPRTRHAVYGGTSNPNHRPAKWYGTLDLTGETPKVS